MGEAAHRDLQAARQKGGALEMGGDHEWRAAVPSAASEATEMAGRGWGGHARRQQDDMLHGWLFSA